MLAMRLMNPVRLSGIPIPFGRLQWMHNAAQAILFTRLFFHARICCCWATNLACVSSSVCCGFSSKLAASAFRLLMMTSRYSRTNSNNTWHNQARILHRYHLGIPPVRATSFFPIMPLDARNAIFSSAWYNTQDVTWANATRCRTESCGGVFRTLEAQAHRGMRSNKRKL